MSKNIPQIIPSPPPEVEETFASYQTAHQFYLEVETRSEFHRYCQWYYKTAQQNRQDLEKMRRELNIMRWFRKR